MKLDVRSSGLAMLTATLLTGCGSFTDDDDGKKRSDLMKQNEKGCIQGVALNGITGQRIGLKQANGKEGVHVIVRNTLLKSKVHVNGEEEGVFEGLKGEYFVCGIPLDTEFPMLVWKDGFQDFEGIVKVESTIQQRSQGAEKGDIDLGYPTKIANVYLYPKGTEANDLLFTVVNHGEVVAGAKVQLKSVGTNTLNDGNEIKPQIRSVPAIQTTNEQGQVTFSGEGLVLGGNYKYTVIPPKGGRELGFKEGAVTVGLRPSGTRLESSPFEIVVPMEDSSAKLAQVASSIEASEFNTEGKIVLWFNQPVELAPGFSEELGATLQNATDAALFAEGTNESLKIEILGNRVTLMPVWKVRAKAATDPEVTVVYSNITLRAVGDSRQENYESIKSLKIRLFDK